jgi:AraC family transcriptional regulator, alkane utilization regulator
LDVLSEVLAAIRMDGAVYINAEFTAPWCAEAQHGLHRVAGRLPRTDHVIFFHLLTQGHCLVRLGGRKRNGGCRGGRPPPLSA